MKELLLCSLWVFGGWKANAQDSLYNPTAILILDRMSNVISDMTSCSFKTVASHDDVDQNLVWSKLYQHPGLHGRTR
jgi:hypothetical protein